MPPRDGEPTRIGCPGCAGVLSAFREERPSFTRYVCTVGHSFSTLGLVAAKEEQFEHGLWAAVSMLAHLDMAYGELHAQLDGAATIPRDAIEARIEQVRRYAQTLRELVEHDRPPALEIDGTGSGAA